MTLTGTQRSVWIFDRGFQDLQGFIVGYQEWVWDDVCLPETTDQGAGTSQGKLGHTHTPSLSATILLLFLEVHLFWVFCWILNASLFIVQYKSMLGYLRLDTSLYIMSSHGQLWLWSCPALAVRFY